MTYNSPFLRRASALAILCSISAACSEGEPPDSIYIPPSTGGNGNGNGTGGGEAVDTAKPVVEVSIEGGTPTIASPAHGTLTALCTPEAADEADTSAIAGSSIKFTLLDSEGEELETIDGAVMDDTPGTYSGTFILETYSTGIYTVSCSAENVASPAAVGTESLEFPLDAGPTITLDSPTDNSPIPTNTPQALLFTVVPAELESSDSGALVSAVQVAVKGNIYEAVPVPDVPNQYRVEIDFTDATKFPNVPSGETLFTLSATNSRGENARTASLTANLLLDGQGPTISIDSPEDTDIVGETVVMKFTAADDLSGIDHSTLQVKINQEIFNYSETNGRWTADGPDISFEFDSIEFQEAKVQISVTITGNDLAGNPGSSETATFYRDNEAPILTMTPPPFRERKPVSDSKSCSYAFDPLGSAATRGGMVDESVLFRTIVWDETNRSEGQTVFYLSGTDQNSVELWVRPADSGPIIEDTSGNRVCDDIIEEGSELKELEAITPTGSPHYGKAADEPPDSTLPLFPAGCIYGADPYPPHFLCPDRSSDLTIVAHHDGIPSEPIVYSLPPPSTKECTGGRWELPSSLPGVEGWVCVAARANDNVGNRGVSIPIAVCLDNSNVAGTPACASDLDNPPPCMKDNCTAPKALPESGIIYDK